MFKKMWDPDLIIPLASTACYRERFTLLSLYKLTEKFDKTTDLQNQGA
jgi:hypothetical protein